MRKIVFIPGPFEGDRIFLVYLKMLFPECEIVVEDAPDKEDVATAGIKSYVFGSPLK